MSDGAGPFDDFIATLDAEGREALLGSIPLLIAMVAGADRTFDEAEMEAAVDALIAAERELGVAFRREPEAQAAFDHLSKDAREGDRLDLAGRLARLSAVVRQMPDGLRGRYQAFVHDLCVHLAQASGGEGFFWFRHAVSPEEKVVLRRIAIALGVRFDDITADSLRGDDDGMPPVDPDPVT